MKKNKGRYRVLLMCTKCDKVYNGTGFINYEKAIKVYHATLVNNKDICKTEKCEEPLIPIIEDREKPKNEDSNKRS